MTLSPPPSVGNIFPQDMFYTEEDILDEDMVDSPRTLSPVSVPSDANLLPASTDSPAVPARDKHGVVTSHARKSNKSFISSIKLPSGKSLLIQIKKNQQCQIYFINLVSDFGNKFNKNHKSCKLFYSKYYTYLYVFRS